MKKFLTIILVLVLVLYLIVPQTVNAATVKISKSKVELNVGDSTTLRLVGVTGITKWTSSDKKVVVVSKKGMLTAITEGEATITATNNKKNYKCYVKVTPATVKVTVSGLLNYFEETAESLSNIGYLEAVTNKDDTITYTLTKQQQKEILAFLKEYFCKEINDALKASDYEGFSKSYNMNDDVTSFDIYVDKNLYLSTDPNYIAFESTMCMLILLSNVYQEYSGIKEDDMIFKFNIYDNDTKELIDSLDQNS